MTHPTPPPAQAETEREAEQRLVDIIRYEAELLSRGDVVGPGSFEQAIYEYREHILASRRTPHPAGERTPHTVELCERHDTNDGCFWAVPEECGLTDCPLKATAPDHPSLPVDIGAVLGFDDADADPEPGFPSQDEIDALLGYVEPDPAIMEARRETVREIAERQVNRAEIRCIVGNAYAIYDDCNTLLALPEVQALLVSASIKTGAAEAPVGCRICGATVTGYENATELLKDGPGMPGVGRPLGTKNRTTETEDEK